MKAKPPRIAIVTVIVLIVLVSLDCALLRRPFGGERRKDASLLCASEGQHVGFWPVSLYFPLASLSIVSLVLTALFSLVALLGGSVVHRLRWTARRPR
jgi:hypothetical protein